MKMRKYFSSGNHYELTFDTRSSTFDWQVKNEEKSVKRDSDFRTATRKRISLYVCFRHFSSANRPFAKRFADIVCIILSWYENAKKKKEKIVENVLENSMEIPTRTKCYRYVSISVNSNSRRNENEPMTTLKCDAPHCQIADGVRTFWISNVDKIKCDVIRCENRLNRATSERMSFANVKRHWRPFSQSSLSSHVVNIFIFNSIDVNLIDVFDAQKKNRSTPKQQREVWNDVPNEK